MIRIAVDAMSGDHGHQVVVPAVQKLLQTQPDVFVILVGQLPVLEQETKALSSTFPDRFKLHGATEVVAMDEMPATALKHKKDSSMRVAINLVKDGQADACVSAGNTGALMAMSRFVLRMIEGIDRPAIISAIPTKKGHSYILDLGANVDCNAEQLLQFALMGSVLVEVVEQNPSPRVALLNNGTEAIKGNDLVKLASDLISKHPEINYTGYIEGNELFEGEVDVIVADGFVGNIALKTAEGTTKFIASQAKSAFKSSLIGMLSGFLGKGAFKKIKSHLDPARYNGAAFLGVQGVVIKSHGNATVPAFTHALLTAKKEVQSNLVGVLSERIHGLLG